MSFGSLHPNTRPNFSHSAPRYWSVEAASLDDRRRQRPRSVLRYRPRTSRHPRLPTFAFSRYRPGIPPYRRTARYRPGHPPYRTTSWDTCVTIIGVHLASDPGTVEPVRILPAGTMCVRRVNDRFVLRFTFILAVRLGLPRPASRVIHRHGAVHGVNAND